MNIPTELGSTEHQKEAEAKYERIWENALLWEIIDFQKYWLNHTRDFSVNLYANGLAIIVDDSDPSGYMFKLSFRELKQSLIFWRHRIVHHTFEFHLSPEQALLLRDVVNESLKHRDKVTFAEDEYKGFVENEDESGYEKEYLCSKCGGINVIPMIYGYLDEEDEEELKRGKSIWGGYNLTYSDSAPEFFCIDCDGPVNTNEPQKCPFCGEESSNFISGRTWKCEKCNKLFLHGEQAYICPWCNSRNVIPIVYGYPTEELWKLVKEGKIALGGCVIEPESPGWECVDCSHTFGIFNV